MSTSAAQNSEETPRFALAPAAYSSDRRARPLLAILPAFILAIALMLPPEARINISGQTLYSYRVAWLLLTPWLVMEVVRTRLPLRLPDVLILLAAGWIVVSFNVVYDYSRGVPSGVAVALDMVMPYFIVRYSIRTLNDLRCLLIALAPFVALLTCLMWLEAVTFLRLRHGAQLLFGALGEAEFGDASKAVIQGDSRLGLLRAMGPFSHPIHAGLFLVSYFALMVFSRVRGWPFWAGATSLFGALATLSSAAFLGLFIVIFLALYERMRRAVSFLNWPILFFGLAALGTALHLISTSGLIKVIIRLTLSPVSGHYRLLIWEHGSQSVANHPWFGLGYNAFDKPYWMNDTIDAFWLWLAIRNGAPLSLLVGMAVLISLVAIALAAGRRWDADRETLVGVAIALATLSLLGFTVAFFGGISIWFFMVVGLATTFASGSVRPFVGPFDYRPRQPSAIRPRSCD